MPINIPNNPICIDSSLGLDTEKSLTNLSSAEGGHLSIRKVFLISLVCLLARAK